MSLTDDPRPPLPEWVLDAYAELIDGITVQEHNTYNYTVSAIARTEAIEMLLSTDELELELEDVEYALMRLLDRGYFYEVGDELRVTTPSEQLPNSKQGQRDDT